MNSLAALHLIEAILADADHVEAGVAGSGDLLSTFSDDDGLGIVVGDWVFNNSSIFTGRLLAARNIRRRVDDE